MKKRFLLVSSLAVALTASAWWVLFPGDDVPRLMVSLSDVTMPEHRKDTVAKSQQLVSLNEVGRAELFRVGGRFEFNPVEGVPLQVEVGSVEPNEDGSFLSKGTVLGKPGSVAVFSDVGGAVAGSVELADGRLFTINHVASGVHRAAEVDFTSSYLDCGSCGDERPQDLPRGTVIEFDAGNKKLDAQSLRFIMRLCNTRRELRGTRLSGLGGKTKFGMKRPSSKNKSQTGTKGTSNKNKPQTGTKGANNKNKPQTGTKGTGNKNKPQTGTKKSGNGYGMGSGKKKPNSSTSGGDARIDLMVVYTPGAAKMFGGEKGIKARINVAVSRSSTAFSESKIKARLNLVHTGQVDYASGGKMSDDLMNMSYRKTSLKKQVAKLRKQYKADLVTLVTGKAPGRVAGLGFLLNRKSPTPQLGFNVVGGRALYYTVLAHECGHNLGCMHDKGNSSGSKPMYDYGHGWRFNANDGKTTRQYRTIMAYAPGSRIGHFSNPNVKYNEVPTGVSNQADNVRVINETAAIVALNSEQ